MVGLSDLSRPSLIRSVEINITDDREHVPVLFMGDVHLGHPNFNEKRFVEYLRYADKAKAYMIYMGDMIEMGINKKLPVKSMVTQTLSPEEQVDMIINTLKPFGRRNLIYITGTHEDRIIRQTGLDYGKIIAKEIGAVHLDLGGWCTLNFNNLVKYNLLLYHGTKGSQTPEYQINKMRKIFYGYDIMAIGHIHQLYHRAINVLAPDEKKGLDAKDIHLLRTGCFLKYTPYDFSNLFEISVNGCPIVTLNTRTRDIRVDINGEGPAQLESEGKSNIPV